MNKHDEFLKKLSPAAIDAVANSGNKAKKAVKQPEKKKNKTDKK